MVDQTETCAEDMHATNCLKLVAIRRPLIGHKALGGLLDAPLNIPQNSRKIPRIPTLLLGMRAHAQWRFKGGSFGFEALTPSVDAIQLPIYRHQM